MIYTSTIDPSCRERLMRDQARYLRSLASRSHGRHGQCLPAVRRAWADTRGWTIAGALLLGAASAAWLWVLS